MQTYDLLKFVLARSSGSSFLFITQYEMPFINKSETTKSSKDVQMARTVGVMLACLFYLRQYFLNRELSFLLNCGKITSIQGYVTIETAQLFCPVAIIVASKYKD